MVNDDNIGWNRKRIFIKPRVMMGVLDNATSGVPASLGTGEAVFEEAVAGSELAALLIGAAGDEVYDFMPIPWDMDVTQPMRFRVWFIHAATSADAPIWKVMYQFFAKQAAVADFIANADETVTFDAHTCSTTNNSLEVTAWAESTSETKYRAGDFALGLAVECDSLGSASGDEMCWYGLWRYLKASCCCH
jgi:hypothetical protein